MGPRIACVYFSQFIIESSLFVGDASLSHFPRILSFHVRGILPTWIFCCSVQCAPGSYTKAGKDGLSFLSLSVFEKNYQRLPTKFYFNSLLAHIWVGIFVFGRSILSLTSFAVILRSIKGVDRLIIFMALVYVMVCVDLYTIVSFVSTEIPSAI